MRISNWGNYPVIEAEEHFAENEGKISELLSVKEKNYISRGLGRSYGDASLNKDIISSLKLNRFLSFDSQNGVLEAESGVSLSDILDVIVPKGWFLPVTPGTKYVSLGGAIAADIHGKNHHKEGSFCDHVKKLSIMTANRKITECSHEQNSDLFNFTCGGMGLTGMIIKATIQLKKIETAFIKQKIHKAQNLEQIFKLFESTNDSTYTVAWIDCLASGKNTGKSVLFTGEHAMISDLVPGKITNSNPLNFKSAKKLAIPFYFPSFCLNNFTIKAFNTVYYYKHTNGSESLIPYEPFFYPLDSVLNWNKMYGKNGFLQYQFVLPLEKSYEGLNEVLNKISQFKSGSFLAVLKLFGKQKNSLSFPEEGYTLALDFPVKKGIFEFLDALDQIVLKYKGKIYLAKDARMKAEIFHQTYSKLPDFINFKKKTDLETKFNSLLSERLNINI